jgi:DUF4097 and DUF4098 domain-containing protein YvlB
MPTFTTSQPITVSLDIEAGDVHVSAGERTETVVAVRPRDSTREGDVRAADGTDVEFSGGRLIVRTPRQRGRLFGRGGWVDITIELPAESDVEGKTGHGTIRTDGALGRCTVKSGFGELLLDEARELTASTGGGTIVVDHVRERADISTGTGAVRVRELGGSATVKNSNGDTWFGKVDGDLRVRSANGSITVDAAGGSVGAVSANGPVRIGALSRGNASLKTGNGEIEVAIAEGTAARLDVRTHYGRVDNRMEPADGPGTGDATADVRARTGYGDIVIRRAS